MKKNSLSKTLEELYQLGKSLKDDAESPVTMNLEDFLSAFEPGKIV